LLTPPAARIPSVSRRKSGTAASMCAYIASIINFWVSRVISANARASPPNAYEKKASAVDYNVR